MKNWLRDSDDLRIPIAFSIGVHLLVILAFSISALVTPKQVLVKPKELQYIKAVVIPPAAKPDIREQEAAKKIEEDRIMEIRRREQQQRAAEEQKRIAAQKAREEKEKLDRQKELERQKQEEQRKLEEKKKQELLAKQKAEEEKKRHEELEKQKALQKQRDEREAHLQRMREAREQQEALRKKQEEIEVQQQQALRQQDQGVLDEYEAYIQLRISQAWQRPLSARNGMSASLQINLMPGGDVASVKVIQSSGDAAFDLSATQAVWRASPLPVPNDAGVFARNYRVFNLIFAPEDLWQ